MSDKVYQKFEYNYNKDIMELLISRKWWGIAFWISIVFGGLLFILSILLGIWPLFSLFLITLFIIIPVSIKWMLTYSHIKSKKLKLKYIKSQINKAVQRERARDYHEAITIWEKLNVIDEAARIRKLKAEQGAVKVAQKVVQGDQITKNVSKTEIKDSVLNRSNVSGGSSKMQELEKLTEMKKEGLIDDDEFKQMKKEILGK